MLIKYIFKWYLNNIKQFFFNEYFLSLINQGKQIQLMGDMPKYKIIFYSILMSQSIKLSSGHHQNLTRRESYWSNILIYLFTYLFMILLICLFTSRQASIERNVIQTDRTLL